jgi:hypothetical protein
MNVKGEKNKYTSYNLIESLYHLTENTDPFKIPNIKATYYHLCMGEILGDVFYELQRMRKMELKGIFNYSVEETEDNASCDANLKQFLNLISSISLFPPISISSVFE